MECRQELHICNSQQQEIGLAASPNMYYVIVYPVRNAWRVDPQGVYKHEGFADSPPSLLNKRLQNNEKSSIVTHTFIIHTHRCEPLKISEREVGPEQAFAGIIPPRVVIFK